MFSFHIYMAEHYTSSEDEAPTKRPTRGATRLRELLIRRAKGQKHMLILTSTLVSLVVVLGTSSKAI